MRKALKHIERAHALQNDIPRCRAHISRAHELLSFGVREDDKLVEASRKRRQRGTTIPTASRHSACTSTFYAKQHQDERTCYIIAAIGFIVKVLYHDTILINAHKIFRPMQDKMHRTDTFLGADIMTTVNGMNDRAISDDVMKYYIECSRVHTQLLDEHGGDFYCLFISFLLTAGRPVSFINRMNPQAKKNRHTEEARPRAHRKQKLYVSKTPYFGNTDSDMTQPVLSTGRRKREALSTVKRRGATKLARPTYSITDELAELTLEEHTGHSVLTEKASMQDISLNEYAIITAGVTGANSYSDSLQLLNEIDEANLSKRFAGCFISLHLPTEDHVVCLVRCGTILQICDSNNGRCIDISSPLPTDTQVFRVDYIIAPQSVRLDTDPSMRDV